MDLDGDGPTVTLDQGKVRGTLRETVARFLAVPYAAAASGDQRWRPPQPLKDAEAPPRNVALHRCPQPSRPTQTFNGYVLEDDEDCLQLNIWTPVKALEGQDASVPVLFYIHGGGGKCHSAHSPRESGHQLALQQGAFERFQSLGNSFFFGGWQLILDHSLTSKIIQHLRPVLREHQLSLGHFGFFGSPRACIRIWQLCHLGSDFCTAMDPEKYCILRWGSEKCDHLGPFLRGTICLHTVGIPCCSRIIPQGYGAELFGPKQCSTSGWQLRRVAWENCRRLGM